MCRLSFVIRGAFFICVANLTVPPSMAQSTCTDASSARQCYEAGLAQVGAALGEFRKLQADFEQLKKTNSDLNGQIAALRDQLKGTGFTVRDQGFKIGDLEKKTEPLSFEGDKYRIAQPDGAIYYFPKNGDFGVRITKNGMDYYCFEVANPAHPDAHDKQGCFK
jgi:septal ring factor EnvC (AmiA/AmiB activator)